MGRDVRIIFIAIMLVLAMSNSRQDGVSTDDQSVRLREFSL